MKKVLIGCLGAVVLLGILAMGAICFWLVRELPVLEASLSVPHEVTLNSTCTMVVTAKNAHGDPVTLDSIDVDSSFLSGFQVLSVVPEPEDTTHVPILDQESWSFGKEVPPGGSLTVTFSLKPIREGHFSGDVDVCNPNQDFKTLSADVVVKGGR